MQPAPGGPVRAGRCVRPEVAAGKTGTSACRFCFPSSGPLPRFQESSPADPTESSSACPALQGPSAGHQLPEGVLNNPEKAASLVQTTFNTFKTNTNRV